MSLLTMVSRVLGLVREMTRASLMGTSSLAEAFSIAFATPNLFRRLFAENTMSVAFIPTMRSYFDKDDQGATEEFLSATFSMLSYLVCAVVAAGVVSAAFIARLYASVAEQGIVVDAAEAGVLMRVMFPFLALVSIAAFLQGILNAHGVFGPSGYAPILFNLAFILVPLAIGDAAGNPARAMALGVVVGGLLQALCQVPAVVRLGARFRFVSPVRALSNPGMRRVMRLLAPTIIGTAAYELNSLVSVALANASGAATSLSLSIRLQELILGVFVASIATVLLPELSGLGSAADAPVFVRRLVRSLETALLVTIPMSVFSIIQRVDIVTLVYKRGAFDDASVALTAEAFLFHSVGLACIGANRILAPAFYARGIAKLPTLAGVASVAVNVGLSLALAPFMGGAGIALALSLAAAVNMAILLAMLLGLGLPGMGQALLGAGWYALRLLAFSCLAAVPVILIRRPLADLLADSGSTLVSSGLPFGLGALLFGAVGVALLAAVRDPVAGSLVSSFIRRKTPRP